MVILRTCFCVVITFVAVVVGTMLAVHSDPSAFYTKIFFLLQYSTTIQQKAHAVRDCL